MKFRFTLCVILCLVAQAAYGAVFDHDGKSYQVSVDKDKRTVSISEIKIDRFDQETKPQDGKKNNQDQKKSSSQISDKNDVYEPIVGPKKMESSETKYSRTDSDGMRNSRPRSLLDEQRRSKRIAAFKKLLASRRDKESSTALIDDTNIAIEVFSRAVHKSLEQLRLSTANNSGNELAVEDVILAELLGKAIAKRIDSIIYEISKEKRVGSTVGEPFIRYRDLSDLKRVEDALDIVYFSEKALQAMGEL